MRTFIDDVTGAVFNYCIHNGSVYDVRVVTGPLSISDCISLVLEFHYA